MADARDNTRLKHETAFSAWRKPNTASTSEYSFPRQKEQPQDEQPFQSQTIPTSSQTRRWNEKTLIQSVYQGTKTTCSSPRQNSINETLVTLSGGYQILPSFNIPNRFGSVS